MKLLLALLFLFSFTIETPESESEENTAVAYSSRQYMEANSELNGVVRDEIDEMDGGY